MASMPSYLQSLEDSMGERSKEHTSLALVGAFATLSERGREGAIQVLVNFKLLHGVAARVKAEQVGEPFPDEPLEVWAMRLKERLWPKQEA